MITRAPNRGALVVAVLFVLASVSLTLFVWRSVGGVTPFEPRTYEVKAVFPEAGQLTENADVRIAGVNVGSVTALRPRGLRTEATLAIDAEYAPLPSDVRAILRQKTLLGETFVAMTPGSRKAKKLKEGATIPAAQIAEAQQLDRVLGLLDEPTRARLTGLLTNGATMLRGRGEETNAALGNIAAGSRELEAIVTLLDGQRHSVRGLVRDTGAVLRTVGEERAAVGELVRSGHRALSATASRSAALTATIRATPGLLRELRATSGAVERSSTAAAPSVRAFRGVAPLVQPALVSLRDTSGDISALLRDVEALVPATRRALSASGAIVSALSPLATALAPTAAEVAPVISYVGAYHRELVATMANVSAATNGTSAASDGRQLPYLRTLTMVSRETEIGREKRLPSNRHNAYRAPGGLAELAFGLSSSSCATAGTGGDAAPPCRLQAGWRFAGGPARYFQRVGPAGSGGLLGAVARLLLR